MRISERELYFEMLNRGLELKLSSTGGDKSANDFLLRAAEWFEKRAEGASATAVQDRYSAALGYYLSGHYAQAYVLFRNVTTLSDPQTAHSLLRRLFSRELTEILRESASLEAQGEYSDVGIAADLMSGGIEEGQAIERMLLASLHTAFASACDFVHNGDPEKIDSALGLLDICYRIAEEVPFPQTYAYSALLQGAIAMWRELRDNSLWTRLHEMISEDDTNYVRRYTEQAARRSPPLIELWPSQIAAIPKINEGQPGSRPNYLVKMPTSAGKTNIAELSFLRFLVDSNQLPGKKCIYIAPFNALGAQVETRLQRHFLPLGVGVSNLYGGFEVNPVDQYLFDQQRILVATPEKLDALLRYKPSFASQIGVVYVDEGHVIEDAERGLRFEMLIHRLLRRYADGSARLIFASAMLGQGDSLVRWFDEASDASDIVTSHFRPTRNYLGLLTWDGEKAIREITHVSDERTGGYSTLKTRTDVRARVLPTLSSTPDAIQLGLFPLDEVRRTKSTGRTSREKGFPKRRDPRYKAVALAALHEARDGMTLVYVPRVHWLELVAKAIFETLDYLARCRQEQMSIDAYDPQIHVLNEGNRLRLRECIDLAVELTGADSLVTRALRSGFVVHYRDVPERLRNALAPLIEQGVFRLIVATNTIMNGVNTPAKTVIIHSLARGSKGDWRKEISPREFLNLTGRAGRAMQETEGVALLFAETKNADRARQTIRNFVKRINTDELVSALRSFLCKVADEWKDHHPGTDVGELCDALATQQMDWLSQDAQHKLGELDRELLALVQELQVSDTSPLRIEDLFERSLVVLQSVGVTDQWHGQQTSLRLLAARVEYLQNIPQAMRYAYYRSGLPITDCRLLDESASLLIERLDTIGQVADYSEKEVADFIWGLYTEFLSRLSIFRTLKLHLPPCSPQLLHGWLQGIGIDEIAALPEVENAGLTRSDVTAFTEEFCGTYLPWGLNAVRGYANSVAPNELADAWLTKWSAMVHFGLPSPKAAIFYALGLRSRKAVIWCSHTCTEPAQSLRLHQWLTELTDSEIEQWQTIDQVKQDVLMYRDQVGLVAAGQQKSLA